MSARDTTLSTSRPSTPSSDEDSGPTRTLRAQRERYAELVRGHQRVPDQITEAYRDAWNRFYLWEPQYCEGMLRTLQDVTLPGPSTVPFSDFISESFSLSDITDSVEGTGDEESLSYQQWFADDERSVSILSVAEEVVVGSRRTPFTSYAYAKYEACTPALQNIKHELDTRILQFIPYADEPGFLRRIKSYASLHAAFAWQHSWYDVDCKLLCFTLPYRHFSTSTVKLIALEAVWHLHGADLSLETMDECQVAFFPLVGGQSGLIASMHHRYVFFFVICRSLVLYVSKRARCVNISSDLIDWGGSFPSAQLSDLRRPQSSFLGRSVDHLTTMFCASMNCVEGLCMLHREWSGKLQTCNCKLHLIYFLQGSVTLPLT